MLSSNERKIMILKKMFRLYFILLLIVIQFLACGPSPLSDVAITDPSVLAVSFSMEKNIFRGDTTQSITARLTDKNHNTVTLLEGGLFLNNIEMVISEDVLSSSSYYLDESSIKLENNKNYTFTIMLADSIEYSTTLRAPDVSGFTLPTEYSVGSSFSVNWDYNSSILDSNITAKIKNGYCDTLGHVPFYSATEILLSDTTYTFKSGELENYENHNCISAVLYYEYKAPINREFLSYSVWLRYSHDDYLIFE